MTRGGRARTREEPERRCIATGETGPKAGLIRFVLDPDGRVVPDLAEKLPGRGAWLTADRAMVDKAVAKRLFARSFRAPAAAEPDLSDRVAALLAGRLIDRIALARKAGRAVTGFEKTRAVLEGGMAGLYLAASDAAADGRDRLARIVPDLPMVTLLDSAELGLAFGRDFAIHAALAKGGGFAKKALFEARRLAGFRVAAGTEALAGPAPKGAAGTGRLIGNTGPGTGPGRDDE
jgi:hypothetical protein